MEHEGLSKRNLSPTFIAGLALFSMLFGAGNLILPIRSGIISGSNHVIGLLGFLFSGVGLPLLGLWGIILFDGDYQRFFYRLGKPVGSLIISICFLVIGPLIGIPRIIIMFHSLATKHLPFEAPTIVTNHPLVFICIMIAIIYFLAYREKAIIRILTYYIVPPFLISLLFIIGIGYMQTTDPLITTQESASSLFYATAALGYQTLDLLAMLFLYSFTFSLLKGNFLDEGDLKRRSLSYTGLKAGLIALVSLTIIYIGLVHLGSVYSPLTFISHGKLFDAVSSQLLGEYGSLVTGLVVFLAGISTALALAALVAEWLQHIVFNNVLQYHSCLFIVLLLSMPASTGMLESTLKITSGPLLLIGYPVIITITICNILYKLFGFKPIKIPTAITFIGATILYIITYKPF